MRITIKFIDGEEIEAESDAVNPNRFAFAVTPTGGNNKLAWISMASVKYIKMPDPSVPGVGQSGFVPPANPFDRDPPGAANLDKIVLRFVDGEVIRAYRDAGFAQEGHCFNVRIHDPKLGQLVRTLVSLHTLKALFFVERWDSRAPEEPLPMTPAQKLHALAASKVRPEGT